MKNNDNIIGKIRQWAQAFIAGCKELFQTPDTDGASDGQQVEHIPPREANQTAEAAEARPGWWQRKNAEYFRGQCPIYIQWIFPQLCDMEKALGKTLGYFFRAHGNFTICRQFPEIHGYLISVKVHGLRPEWNERGLDLRQALLDELRRAFVGYAETKRYPLSGILNAVILNAWQVEDTLYLEIPASVFSIQYPELARILASPDYWNVRQALTAGDRL